MAVIKTGAIFNGLTFGGVNSVDYGIYITGEAVYNAPIRAVEMVSVPGRNGAIIVDQGYWENIEVSYPCGTFAKTQAEFAENLASFRNAILSQKGYKRLEDTYHPDEYRMATYISGLEVSPVNMGHAGEFELIFNAKPQRFLTSGETEVPITSGDTLTNPTANDANPLLMIRGYGELDVNGYNINIQNATLGTVTLAEQATSTRGFLTINYDKSLFNTGDQITAGDQTVAIRIKATSSNPSFNITGVTVVTQAGYITYTSQAEKISNVEWRLTFILSQQVYSVGTRLDEWLTALITVAWTVSGTSGTSDITFQLTRRHLSSGSISWSYHSSSQGFSIASEIIVLSSLRGVSTVSILGDPTYIDCDLGVCYKFVDGSVIDLNPYIDLGSDLPVLSPGDNEITFDNTITSVEIIPRWWQL